MKITYDFVSRILQQHGWQTCLMFIKTVKTFAKVRYFSKNRT